MELTIRQAHSNDAKAISQVIVAAVRESNSQDYPESVIASVVANFTPGRVIELLEQRLVFFALLNDKIVGTGALDGDVVHSLFIAPCAATQRHRPVPYEPNRESRSGAQHRGPAGPLLHHC